MTLDINVAPQLTAIDIVYWKVAEPLFAIVTDDERTSLIIMKLYDGLQCDSQTRPTSDMVMDAPELFVNDLATAVSVLPVLQL